MRRFSGLFSRPRIAGALVALGVGLVALIVVLALSGGAKRSHSAELAQACRPGLTPADNPAADNGGGDNPAADKGGDQGASAGKRDKVHCVLMGGPEQFADLNVTNTELGERTDAPFTTSAPGAYLAAYRQRQKLAAAAHPAADTAHAWSVAGTPPECANQTSGSSTCPAPGAANGDYSYMASLGFRTLSGRISSFAYDPSQPAHFYASPVVGGVWESLNSGATWHSIGDGLPTQVVGAIAYDAPLHRIIAGTGDNSFGGDGIAGHGIYYSDDDGVTWQTASGIPDLALSFKVVVSPVDHSGNTVYAATSKGLYRSANGGASWVNENLPTSPAGYSPNCAGDTVTRLCFFANDVTDVIVKPTTTANGPAGAVIAAVGWRAGQKVDTDANGNNVSGCTLNGSATPCLQAPQNGLYSSTTGAPGSFSYIPVGSGGITGLPPTNIFGRTALAIAHGAGQNSDAIYALVQDAVKFNGCPDVLDQPSPACDATVTAEGVATVLDGMYASYDFGKTWTKIMDYTQLQQHGTNSSLTGQAGYEPGVQSWYNLWVDADPTATDATTGDPTRVLFGLEEVWENNPQLPSSGGAPPSVLATPFTFYPGGTPVTDPWLVIGRYWNACGTPIGGLTTPVGPCNPNPFTGGPVAGTTTHPDQHAEMMIPDGKGGVTLVIGSDGGAYSQHVASGGSFSNDNWGDGLNATISAVQPYDAEMSKDGTIVSGLQDNGEMKTAPNGHEAEIYGGDAFYTTIDPNHSNNMIEEYTYASQVNMSEDGGASWFPITPGNSCGGSTTALFSTPIEQDPTMPGHILIGCTQLQEATNAYANPCAAPAGATAANCQATNSPFNSTYDLSTLPSPNSAPNIPSALAVRGANEYVGYCGYCDTATQGIPFGNGIATNVGGSAAPKIGTTNGWHQAAALCSDCQTANGKLPERYITSIQEDPSDPSTVYVTLGGYERRWIPPGAFGEDTSNVGVGHLFVSHDHGEHFTNISGNLPDIAANWTAFHNGQLVVATDLGVYISDAAAGTGSPPTYSVLGTGLPLAPVFTVRVSPQNPNLLLVATYGRGDWLYDFGSSSGGGGGGSGGGGGGGGGTAKHCPAPSGKLSGTHLGRLALGFTVAQARRALPKASTTHFGFDNFCLKGGPGIRVGYPSGKLLRSLPASLRGRVAGRIVLALTANRHYALRGIRPGARLGVAERAVGRNGHTFRVGANDWYIVPAGRKGAASSVLKVRGGIVIEIGIADKRLITSIAGERRFIRSFGAV